MANQDSAFGLRAIGKIGQNRDAQGLSEYSIAASATAIYQGDPVKALATGTIGVANSSANVLLGSLNGIFYTDPSTQKPTWANHLAASNAATDIVGYVSDDPYERFEIQSNNAGASAQTDVFMNYDIAYAAGGSPNFISKVELDDSSVVSTTAQLRIIGVSKDPDNSELASANTNFVVEIVEHFYKQAAGI
tara:strand:+ start:351 stop:923 length:573 start_codon:yes stop_codon:yes gene_type:complete